MLTLNKTVQYKQKYVICVSLSIKANITSLVEERL